jgi:hypothetical protein
MVKRILHSALKSTGVIGLIALAPAAFAADAKPMSTSSPAANPHTQDVSGNWKLLETYCVECHNATDWAGGVAFDTMVPDTAADDAEIWEKAVRKMRGSLMPPPGKKQPGDASRVAFISTMESFLDQTAAGRSRAGSVGLHRLNRTEYANAVEDLLGLRIDPAALLPRDDKSDGFDNAADVLKVSPAFLEQYISAARQVTVDAIGNPKARTQSRVYQGAPEANQYVHQEGLPLGTRGGMLIEHEFPADGDYEFTINGLVGAGYLWGVMDPNTLIITLDGVRVFEQKLGGDEDLEAVDVKQAMGVGAINDRFRNIRRHVKAGPHQVGVTFLAKTAAESNEILHGFVPVAGMGQHVNGDSDGPRIQNVEVKGPFNAAGVSETPTAQDLLLPARERSARAALRGADLLERRAQGISPSGDGRRSRGRHGFLQAGPRSGWLRDRHPEGPDGDPGQPEVSLPRAHAAAGRTARPGVPHHGPGPGLASFVFPVEPRPG